MLNAKAKTYGAKSFSKGKSRRADDLMDADKLKDFKESLRPIELSSNDFDSSVEINLENRAFDEAIEALADLVEDEDDPTSGSGPYFGLADPPSAKFTPINDAAGSKRKNDTRSFTFKDAATSTSLSNASLAKRRRPSQPEENEGVEDVMWMLLSKEHAATYYNTEGETVYCHLTEEQLRTIHKRFGHPLAGRFAAVLKRAEHEFKRDLLYNIQKFCHHCQVFGRSPGRFSIRLKDDTDFNDTVNTYVGPFTNVMHDPGTNFNSATFRGYLKAIKAINDTAGLNSLVLILLVFKTLSRLTEQDRPAASTQERAAAINKAMKEVRKCYAAKQVKDALKKKNGPITEHTLDLLISSRKYDLNISTVPDEKEGDSYVLFTKDSEVLITDKERRCDDLKRLPEGTHGSAGFTWELKRILK
ncbi:hypothetical protein MBM_08175 [Drepanopeziza brunnea f. sp. 'multigermtubi' MB_m1]|uniref:Uncharacterized protein n=1 Tax=Marssonina brunnea f. sp. multigermtubi (strain MB_m1) TaxID=1072389 RepID=K1WM98_MARBU|nr:uncharacterized protein MBM_08175 [Drepanopeziza brunnea f. sp. 'multigermtubi' MB_m1]EKD13457.1 hypothetical protein MBM_08175 [Drepanopeziza brunnea f. sp. 'multigermtubi' MB_m1]